MPQMTFDYHPVGTVGFVADSFSVREVVVEDVIMLMSLDRGVPRHVVRPVSGKDLWHDQYPFRRIHPTAETAAVELERMTKARLALDAARA